MYTSIQLNSLPGLGDLPDEFTFQGLEADHPSIPKKDPNYVFNVDDVRVLWGLMTNDGPEGLMLTGPRGSGKSSVIRQFHAYLRRPLFYVAGHHSLEFDDLIGVKEIVAGDTLTMDGPLTTAVQTENATFLFEEIDRARTEVSVSLNPLLDGYDLIHTLDGGRPITPKPGFKFMATANTSGNGDMTGEYNAANVMDQSIIDRVWMHEVWYPSPEAELNILRMAVPNAPEDQLRRSIAFANDVRYLFTGRDTEATAEAQQLSLGPQIETTLSTRTLISFWRALSKFPSVANPIHYALGLVVSNKCSAECKEALEKLAEAQFAGG